MNSSRTWSILAGLLSLIIGFILLVWPGKSLVTLVWIFGIFALLYGFIKIGEGIFRRMDGGSRAWYIIGGLLSILLGALIMAWPGATILIIVWLIAFRALLVGIFEMIVGFSESMARWLIWVGILNILFGLVIFFFTGASVVALVWLVALYLIVVGIADLVTGFSGRNIEEPAA